MADILPFFFPAYDNGFLTLGGYTFAIWKNGSSYWLYDSHAKDENGKVDGDGVSFCASFDSVQDLSDCIGQNFRDDKEVFSVVGVKVCKSAVNKNKESKQSTP